MRRLFWIGVGAAVGILVVRKITKTAEAYSPRGLAGSARGSAVGLLDSVRAFVEDARVAMAEQEVALTRALEQQQAGEYEGGQHRAP
ncbi:hypothetical protein [Cryptosporangium phraense]|uniref:YtxH domain-containing protein n=1 Tax=Cryptosporangium phraense TaxID=2593070 RepID=A0A545AK07_9ACTN|nr:hypothetical protein [Cryptosporangium phraense]TQS41611.1 hypothetical protein FL583_28535 [Cryptosporangium phraense]